MAHLDAIRYLEEIKMLAFIGLKRAKESYHSSMVLLLDGDSEHVAMLRKTGPI